ncbi:hypothetical protein EV363DRAFT_1167115 [Boletus edulis]|nr:hypothetical protein EV363DRAFT_1167115 [Boletus edulis]
MDFVPLSSELVYYLWTSVHQPQSLQISAGVQQGQIWTLTLSTTRSATYTIEIGAQTKQCLSIDTILGLLCLRLGNMRYKAVQKLLVNRESCAP